MPDTPLDWQHLLHAWPHPGAGADAGSAGLAEITTFGDDPGNLRMLVLVPDDRPAGAPLVVVLHGCTQTAAAFARDSGWMELAQRHRFALLVPEQRRANNGQLCFSWFEPGDVLRGSGEVASIAAMVRHMLAVHRLDARRVFVTGLSAGGALAAALLATYADLFAGGAIMAGLPYGGAASIPEAFQQMHHPASRPPKAWGDRVRAASPHRGPWPSVAVWQGAADTTVVPANARELLKQWLDVHDLAGTRAAEDRVEGVPHRAWRDAGGEIRVEAFMIPGMDHGAPVAVASGNPAGRCGRAAPFVLDVGISAAWHMAQRWGLLRPAAEQASVPAAGETVRRHPAPLRAAAGLPASLGKAGQVIERALRAAGLQGPSRQ